MTCREISEREPQRKWGRLKAVNLDPLEVYGLPSKGDKGLLDSRVQESYYKVILDRCLQLCPKETPNDDIDQGFDALNLNDQDSSSISQDGLLAQAKQERLALARLRQRPPIDPGALSTILQAMRKLREAILASNRLDTFARDIYVFTIRATIVSQHVESYHPSLLYILRRMHPEMALSQAILHEMLGYRVLDAACRLEDLNAAYKMQLVYNFHDKNINLLLKALAHGNWWRFWAAKARLDPIQQVLVDFASDRMRRHAIGCISKSYLSIEKVYVEKAVQRVWEYLPRDYGVTWMLESGILTIRQVKRK